MSDAAPVTIVRTASRMLRHAVTTVLFVLAVVVLWPAQVGGVTGLTIVSGASMEPTYRTGDLVVTLRLPQYSEGDVVSYVVPEGQPGAGGRVIHRISAVESVGGETTFTSVGDNNDTVDPWRFAADDVMGVAVLTIPQLGTVFGAITNPLAVGLGAGALITLLLWPRRVQNAPREQEAVPIA